MSTSGWSDFQWWRERYEAAGAGLDEPFSAEPWTDDTTFVWAKVIEPVRPGVGAPSGFWATFPHPRAAAGALRFVLLPDWFGAYLGRDDWDDDPEAFLAADELLARAADAAPEEAKVELPLMRELLAALDSALALADAAPCQAALTEVLERLSAHWHGTGTWDFSLEAFHGPVALAAELALRRTEYLGDDARDARVAEALGMTRPEWDGLFLRALTDTDARDEVQALLDDDAF